MLLSPGDLDAAATVTKYTSGIKGTYHLFIDHQRINTYFCRFGHSRRCPRITTLGQLNRHLLEPDEFREQLANELLGVLNGGRGAAIATLCSNWPAPLATAAATRSQYANLCKHAQYS